MRLPDGRLIGVEALVRWHHPEPRAVPPDVFIPVAERTGLIVPLGDWILREALPPGRRVAAPRSARTPRDVSVNVSARQLREPGFADDVAAALADTGLPADRLVLEVTETAVFDGGRPLATLHELAGLGRDGGAGRLRHRPLVARPAADRARPTS